MGNGCSSENSSAAQRHQVGDDAVKHDNTPAADDAELQQICAEFQHATEERQLAKASSTVLSVAQVALSKLVALDLPFPIGPLCSLANGVVGLAVNFVDNLTEARQLAERVARVHFTVIDVSQRSHLSRHATAFHDILVACRVLLEGFHITSNATGEDASLLDRIRGVAHSVSSDTKEQISKLHVQLNQLSLDTALTEVLTIVPAMHLMHREVMGMLADFGGTLDKVAADALKVPTVADNLEAVRLIVSVRMQDRLGDVSIPLQGSKAPSCVSPCPMLALVDEWLNKLSPTTAASAPAPGARPKRKVPHVLIIEGGPGSGKSYFVHSLVQRSWSSASEHSTPMFLVPMQSATEPDHMIDTVLRRCGVSADATVELKRRPVVFVLDALDEWPTQRKVFTQTDLQDWPNAHVVITTRPEFLLTWGTGSLLPEPAAGSPAQPQHLYCVPFSPNDIKRYVEEYAASLGMRSDDAGRIYKCIEGGHGLASLCSNPFVLSRVVALMAGGDNDYDEQQQSSWTRRSTYARWIAMHQRREISRLQGKSQTNIPKLGSILSDLLVALVLEVLRARETSPPRKPSLKSALSSAASSESIELLTAEKRVVQDEIVRSMPVRVDGDQFAFIHESVFEFLVSTLGVHQLNSSLLQLRPLRIVDASLIRFLAERAAGEGDEGLRAALWSALNEHSDDKDHHYAWPAAANALSLLIVAERRMITDCNFNGLNLSGAILDGAVFQRCTFRNADLSNVSYHNVRTYGCDFTGASFTDAAHERLPIRGHTLEVSTVRFSLDGLTIASCGSDETVRLWSVASGNPLHVLKGHSGKVYDVRFHPLANCVVASCDHAGTVILWDSTQGTTLRKLRGHTRPVKCVSFSADGNVLASSGSTDLSVRLWDTESGACVHVLLGHEVSVEAVAFHPRNPVLLLSYGGDGAVRVWNATSGALVHVLRGHSGRVSSACFSPDGSIIASCGDDNTVQLWNVTTGQQMCLLPDGHQRQVNAVGFSPDGSTVASGGWDGTVRVWDVASGAMVRVIETEGLGIVTDVSFSPDGRLIASCGWDKAVRLYDAHSGAPLHVFEGHADAVENIAFSPDGCTVASCSADKTVRLWNTASLPTPMHDLQGHTDIVTSVDAFAAAPDGGVLVTSSPDGTVKLWEGRTGSLMRSIAGCNATSAYFNANGDSLVASGWGGVFRHLRTDGTVVSEFASEHSNRSARISHDGTMVAACCDDRSVRLWQYGDGVSPTSPRVLEGHTGNLEHLCFSPDDRRIASCGDDKTIRVWSTASGDVLLVLKGHGLRVTCVCFSPDGKLIASSSCDKTARVWDAATGVVVAVLAGHSGYVEGVCFAHDGSLIATCSDDHTVRIWRALDPEGKECPSQLPTLCVLRSHNCPVRAVTFTPDDGSIVSSGQDIIVERLNTQRPPQESDTTITTTITAVIGCTLGSHACDGATATSPTVRCPLGCRAT